MSDFARFFVVKIKILPISLFIRPLKPCGLGNHISIVKNNVLKNSYYMSKYSLSDILLSIDKDDVPPSDYSPELTALWHTKKGNWDNAHDIVSDINSKMGSWIHAHLHVIEGDLGNAAYWYNRSQRDPISPEQLEEEWILLVESNL